MSFFSCKILKAISQYYVEYCMVNDNKIISSISPCSMIDAKHDEIVDVDGFWEGMKSVIIKTDSVPRYQYKEYDIPESLIIDDCYYKCLPVSYSGYYYSLITIYYPDEKHDVIRNIMKLMNLEDAVNSY